MQSRPVDLHLCLTLVGGFHLILRCAASILVITFRTAVWRWQVAVCAPATPAPRRPRVGPRTRGGSLGRREREGGGWGETQAGRARGRKGSQTMATKPVSRIHTSLHIAVLDRQAEYCKYARVHIYSPGVMQYSTKRPSRFRSGGGRRTRTRMLAIMPPTPTHNTQRSRRKVQSNHPGHACKHTGNPLNGQPRGPTGVNLHTEPTRWESGCST